MQYPASFVRQFLAVLRLARLGRPDVIHIQCPSVQVPAVTLAARVMRVPLILTSQGETVMDAANLYGTSTFMRSALRWSARQAASLTTCSAWTALQASRIAPEFTRAHVVLNGVQPDQWRVSPAVDDPVVVAWGRHVPQKGFDLLIRAFADVRETMPAARLLLGGSGSETETLRAMAGDGVEFVGALDRDGVRDLLVQSRVVAVPSRLEPFGIVALEAMASGRPVVWSTIGGLGDATGGHGWGVDPHDHDALVVALLGALRAKTDEQTLRAHAESLSWSKIAQHYLEIYVQQLPGQDPDETSAIQHR
jgi:glycosyltransferase involved in cell wall biosynthesis